LKNKLHVLQRSPTNYPTVTTTAGDVIPLGGGETTSNCPKDCGYPANAGCSVCGYDGSGHIETNAENWETAYFLIG
jgi:hypothetical protein